MVRLRLQRHGRKRKPFYYIVAADGRAPRDGRFIERIGSYNPNTNPATIDLNLDAAVHWLENGAIPSHTCRAILSYKGAMHKHHLNKGVKKGAFTQEEADAKFNAWLGEKEGLIESKREGLSKAEADAKEAAHQKEVERRATMEAAIAAKNAPVVEETEEEVAEEASTEEVVAEAPAEEVVAEAPAEEAPVAEAPAEEAPAAEAEASEEDKA